MPMVLDPSIQRMQPARVALAAVHADIDCYPMPFPSGSRDPRWVCGLQSTVEAVRGGCRYRTACARPS